MEGNSTEERPNILRQIFSIKFVGLIVFITVIASAIYMSVLYWSSTVPADFDFRVEEGDTVKDLANRLSDKGIIKHPLFFYFSYFLSGGFKEISPGGYKLSNTMKAKDIIRVLQDEPWSKFVTIPPNASKDAIAELISKALGWDELDRQFFGHTYAGMQWQHYQEFIQKYFQTQYSWNDSKTHTFLTLSAIYYDNAYDFMKNMYVPGTYEIPVEYSRAQVAGVLIDRFTKEHPDNQITLRNYIDKIAANSIAKLIDEQMILMPDIVAIPPRDLTIRKVNGFTYLLFTTMYWNKGRGSLELVADPSTKGIRSDHERNVYQRIYHLDGDYTERLSGKFLWHSPHLHYHFQDFAVYHLEPVDVISPVDISPVSQKSTFCIRDSEPIDLAHPGADKQASYTICGKERQGISPGWADSYYYTYVDQKFDVTKMPTGTYTLKFVINPLNRFQEITKDNNVGEATIYLDKENGKVKMISERTYGL